LRSSYIEKKEQRKNNKGCHFEIIITEEATEKVRVLVQAPIVLVRVPVLVQVLARVLVLVLVLHRVEVRILVLVPARVLVPVPVVMVTTEIPTNTKIPRAAVLIIRRTKNMAVQVAVGHVPVTLPEVNIVDIKNMLNNKEDIRVLLPRLLHLPLQVVPVPVAILRAVLHPVLPVTVITVQVIRLVLTLLLPVSLIVPLLVPVDPRIPECF
jgi:hypothetical protein